jgi:RecA/RadA recombinase
MSLFFFARSVGTREEVFELRTVDRIPTHCKAVDLLLNGGLAPGTITQFFGERAEGKSLLSLQTAFAMAASGNSSIIVDTEQSYKSYLLESWAAPLSKRFGKEVSTMDAVLRHIGIDDESRKEEKGRERKKRPPRSQVSTAIATALNKLDVPYTDLQVEEAADIFVSDLQVGPLETDGPSVTLVQVPEVTDLIGLHGATTAKAVSDGGRVELRLLRTPTYDSPLRRMVRATKAKLLIYDSISAPFKASFPSTQDLPARSAGLAMMLSHAQRLCVEFGLAVLTVSHVSINPIHQWEGRPYGGAILGYEAKFSVELTGEHRGREKEALSVNPEDEMTHSRRAWLARHPATAPFARFGFVNFDEGGIH